MDNCKVICITGTPGVGKTTISKLLNEKLLKKGFKSNLSFINEIAINHDLTLGYDEEKGFNVVDICKLDKKFSEIIADENTENEIVIVDGHLSHFCSRCDKVIVLRVKPDVLKKRLIKRNYSENKVKDNLESEVLAICSYEANELHKGKVNELDISSLKISQILQICIDVIQGKTYMPVGNIDFMDYFLKDNQ
ncbi:MAG: adenylate kinase family protein [Methanobrevibacter sp.]|jgi:adenylate kinase|nr:adenylate kinase family protein [Candidatus Methanovirga australis]